MRISVVKKNNALIYFGVLCMVFIAFSMILITAPSEIRSETIKIGMVADLSDIAGDYGRLNAYAAAIAVEDINQNGGVLGKQVELVKRDGKNDPELHYQYVDDLAKDTDIAMLLGGAASPSVARASEAALKNEIPYMISIGNSESITVHNGHPYVFQFQPNSAMETRSWATFMTLFPWKKYSWIGPDYEWGHTVYDDFIQHFKRIGIEIDMASTFWHPMGQQDFSAIINGVLASKPEMLILGTWGNDIIRFYKEASRYGLFEKIPVFGRLLDVDREEMDKNVGQVIWAPSRAPFNYLAEKYDKTKSFVETFKKRYGRYPLSTAICCYDAILAWHAAVNRAGTVERKAVAKALKGIHFQGLRGKSYIREVDGQMNSSTYFGILAYDSAYDSHVLTKVVEVMAERVWLSPEKVAQFRSE